ncbi:Peroxisomal acyl-coenzyme A thioester hydrolase 1 [Candida viswanathii]|uniref:Peroxisomal acyl-coenzyme A thioester hydrolase 1 n=1 Tax=Candida viswanathii TaxID=5486 RepID=A0A367XMT4_9ASCO|nr:Peroxisomal acyl-coenzyme A thioester hydrolase 1 [Candida viswanathii]
MERLQAEVYDAKPTVAKLETKSTVKLVAQDGKRSVYEAIYPVEHIKEGIPGAYGGDTLVQGVNAAWDKKDFQPHSVHSYFVKPATNKSILRWEVIKISDGRSFANRLVSGYQTHNNALVFTMQISFAKYNDEVVKVAEYNKLLETGDKIRSIPFVIKKAPNEKYFKFKDNLGDLRYIEHTNGNIATAMLEDLFEYATEMNHDTLGNQEFGIFMKVLDNYSLGSDYTKQSYLGLAFLSDAIWTSVISRALGLPFGSYHRQFFGVSMDHSMYFHDANFDSTEWIFLDFRFVNLKNDRLLGVANFYTLEGKLISTLIQEVYLFLHPGIIDKSQEIAVKSGNKRQVKMPKL